MLIVLFHIMLVAGFVNFMTQKIYSFGISRFEIDKYYNAPSLLYCFGVANFDVMVSEVCVVASAVYMYAGGRSRWVLILSFLFGVVVDFFRFFGRAYGTL